MRSLVLLPISLILGLALACQGMSPYGDPLDSDDSANPDSDTDTDTDTDSDTDTDTDTDVEPLSVNSIEPSYGTTAGNTVVTIVGGPFDASARVFFGAGANETQGTVQSATANTIVARTPSWSSDPGFVDVQVVTDTHAGTGNELFQYFEDGTGLTGVMGALAYDNYAGSYWSGTSDPVSAWLVILEPPVDVSVADFQYAPTRDQCRLSYSYGSTVYAVDPGLSAIRLTRPDSGFITLTPDSVDTFWFEGTYAAGSYVQNGYYGLGSTIGSTVGYPALEIEDFVRAPGSFSLSSPSVYGSSIEPVTRANFNVAWSGAGGGDYVLMEIVRYTYYDSTTPSNSTGEVVTCWVNDDGSFKVPSSVFSGWTTYEPIILRVGRVIESNSIMPHNNAGVGMVGIYWVNGAVYQD